jgi:hypothetical protein
MTKNNIVRREMDERAVYAINTLIRRISISKNILVVLWNSLKYWIFGRNSKIAIEKIATMLGNNEMEAVGKRKNIPRRRLERIERIQRKKKYGFSIVSLRKKKKEKICVKTIRVIVRNLGRESKRRRE